MVRFASTLDYPTIHEGSAYKFSSSTKWKCISCVGISVYIYHLVDLAMGGGGRQFLDLECEIDEEDTDSDDCQSECSSGKLFTLFFIQSI